MNPNFLYPHPDANASSLAHLHHLPPGANPAPNPAPIPPQLHNRAQPQRAPLHPEQDGMDVDTGPDPRGTARESSPDQSPERGLKRARPDTDQAETLEHSEPVYKQRRTSSPEPTHAQPQARAILSPEAIKTELRQAVGDGNLDRLVSLKKQVGNIAEIFDQDFEWIATHCPNAAVMAWFVGQGCNIHQVNSDEYNALILAAAGGHLEVVQYFAHQGCDMQQVNIEGDNALTMAARYGHIEVVKWLFEKNCYVHQVDDSGDNALTLAAAGGHLELVKWLFEKNCPVDQLNGNSDNALTLAAEYGHLELVKWLFEKNCSVHQVNDFDDNALTLAAAGGHLELVKWLFEKNCYVHQVIDGGDNALTLAAAKGHLELVKWLFEKNCYVHQVNSRGNNALTLAARSGHLELVKWLFEKNCSVHQPNIFGDNALTLAAADGHLDVVKWLITQNCSVRQVNIEGDNALTMAARYGHIEVVKWLFEKNCYVHQKNKHSNNALTLAARSGHLELVKWLFEKNCSVRQVDNFGNNALTIAAAGGHLDVVKWLFEKNCAVDQVNISGDNALTLAVRRGHLELVQWLVEKGSDIDHLNNDGRTALALAMAHKETAIACDLIKRGANVHIGGSTHGDGLLFDALDLGDTVLISLLIPLHDVSLRSASRRTPLMVAAKKNLIEVAAPLIQASSASPLALTLIAEAFPLAKKPLFRELLWNPPLTSNAIPLHSSLLPDMTPLIASAVVSEHVFSDNEKLLSLQSKLGAGGLMNLMQMRSAKMSVLAELPAWILQHPVEEIFNDASLSDDLVRLQNKVITFIKDDIEVLATIATGWEEAHLIPVVENLYESCLRHCLSEHPATDIVSTLSGAGLYQPIAQRIANAWMSAWATVPRAAPLLRPVAATHIDDRDNEDLADLDPNTGEVVIRPDTVARNIGRFIDSPTGAELLRAFSTALQREFDSVAASILRINDTQLSEQSKNLYADLIGRQLHLIAQFWRATA